MFLSNILTYQFVILGILAMFFISIITSILGNFIVHKKIYFIIPTVSHSAFAGLALACLIESKSYLIAIVFSICFLLLVIILKNKLELDYNSVLSAIFIFAMALGILFISLKQSYDPELNTILFGNILTVSKFEVIVLGILAFISVLVYIIFNKAIKMIIFDEEFARIENVPVNLTNAILFSLITFTIIFSLKAIGTILIFAYFILPPLIAFELSLNFNKLIWISFLVSLFASLVSILLSFYFNIPSGSSLVIVLMLVYFLIVFIKLLKHK